MSNEKKQTVELQVEYGRNETNKWELVSCFKFIFFVTGKVEHIFMFSDHIYLFFSELPVWSLPIF